MSLNQSTNIILPFGEKFIDVWNLWKDYKKETFGFVYKGVYSEQMTLRTLTELSDGDEDKAIRIIEQSIMRQWQGLFPLHIPSTKNNGERTKKQPKQPSKPKEQTGSSSTFREGVQAEFNKRFGGGKQDGDEPYLKAV